MFLVLIRMPLLIFEMKGKDGVIRYKLPFVAAWSTLVYFYNVVPRLTKYVRVMIVYWSFLIMRLDR